MTELEMTEPRENIPLADAAKVRARAIASSMQQALAQRHLSDIELNPLTGVYYQVPDK